MLKCPDCNEDKIFVIDSRLPLKGKYIRRRLKCGNCESRFTSYEIRERDIADNSKVHFSMILDKIRSETRIPKPFRGILKPKPEKVLVSGSIFQRCSSFFCCCSKSGENTVNY